jgi:hypothetical protein
MDGVGVTVGVGVSVGVIETVGVTVTGTELFTPIFFHIQNK